jgi:porin
MKTAIQLDITFNQILSLVMQLPVKEKLIISKELEKEGINVGFSAVNEIWGNTMGGIKTGCVTTSLLQGATSVDLEKLMGWKGASFYSRWLYLYGQDPSANLVGDVFAVSNISGYSTFRNIDLWIEQKFFDDKIALRVGQLEADSDFAISDYAAMFINADSKVKCNTLL